MNLYVLIPAAAFCISAFAWVYVLGQRRPRAIKRAYLAFGGAIALWVLLDVLGWSAVSEALHLVLIKVQPVAWLALAFLSVNLTYALLARGRDAAYWLFFGVALLSMPIAAFTDLLYTGVQYTTWGTREMLGVLFVPLALPLPLAGAYSLALLAMRLKQGLEPGRRPSLRLVLVGGALALALGLTTAFVVPDLLGILALPDLASSISAGLAFVVCWAVVLDNDKPIGADAGLAIFESTRTAVIVTDLQGRVSRMNQVASNLLALDPNQATESDLCRALGCDELAETDLFQSTIQRDEGTYRLVVSVSPLSREALVLGKLVTILDLTTLEGAEEEKSRLEAQLLHSQKMEAIGTLAGGVAHEMNNILAAVTAFATALENELPPTSPWREDVEGIVEAGARGREQMRALLGLARKGGGIKQRIDLVEAIRDCVERLERASRKEITIASSLPESPLAIRGDPAQIKQLLTNLCVNAIEAMGDGGRLEITARQVELVDEDLVGFANARPGLYMSLQVRDTGAGMDKRAVQRAFEPFYSTKAGDKKTGLGLSTVYATVVNHGGLIRLESEVEVGTLVTVCLPAADARSRNSSHKPAPAPSSHTHGGATILLVDDDVLFRRAGLRDLERLGYDVLTAENGQVALDLYRERPDTIHVVLLDLVMPVMDGGEAFTRLRQLDPDLPVVLCSGRVREDMAKALLAEGANAFLEKPFTIDQLAAELSRALGR